MEKEYFMKSAEPRVAKLKKVTNSFFEVYNPNNSTFMSEPEIAKPRCSVDSQCFICYTYDADSVLSDCLHGGLCRRCAEFIVKSHSVCSLCRKKSEAIYVVQFDHDAVYAVKEYLVLTYVTVAVT